MTEKLSLTLVIPPGLSVPYLKRDVPHSDVRISCGSTIIRGHRVILGTSCPLIKQCLLELDNLEEDPTIVLAERAKDDVEKALDVLYGSDDSVRFSNK